MFFSVVKTRPQPHLEVMTNTSEGKCADFGFLGTGLLTEKLPAAVKQHLWSSWWQNKKASEMCVWERERNVDQQKTSSFVFLLPFTSVRVWLDKKKKKNHCESCQPKQRRWASASLGFSERLLSDDHLLWWVAVCLCACVCVSDVYMLLRSSLRRQGGEINVRCGDPRRYRERRGGGFTKGREGI